MIEIKELTYLYEGASRPSLNNVSLTVKQGEMLAIVGHNGSGKSTLAKHLNGLLLPEKGKVLVDGMDTANEDEIGEIRRRIGMVFQNPDNQLVTTIVEEDVAFGPENLGVEPKEIRERVDGSLALVGMDAYKLKASHALSGGQKQRIAIAGMLAMQPDTLVLDEATAMLDPSGRKEVLSIVERLHREKGMTVVMITQYMEEVACCDRVVVMCRGEIVAEGTPREVFAMTDVLERAGLEAPETVRLWQELKTCGFSAKEMPVTTEETVEAICRSLSNN
ncbi:MAG: energy-coupling factor transporter ATPase [Clostridia bacterium]|nr:energy-coupling factor transporter ATPase [Clostridia bacterium]